MAKKAIGQRGSWFATVDNEELPCVHKYWWVGKSSHFDPNIKIGDHDQFVEAIKKRKRVILTDDYAPESGSFERKGYIAVYDVDDVRADDTGLRFEFTKRVDDLI